MLRDFVGATWRLGGFQQQGWEEPARLYAGLIRYTGVPRLLYVITPGRYVQMRARSHS